MALPQPLCLPLNKEARVLLVYIVLFTLITAAQYVASLPPFANSLALRADCLSMLVDTLTYMGNLAAVLVNGSKRTKRILELTMSGLSLVVLLVLTLVFTAQAVDTVRQANDADHDGVDVAYVLAFAVLGLVFDGSGIAAFLFCPEDEDESKKEAMLSPASAGGDSFRASDEIEALEVPMTAGFAQVPTGAVGGEDVKLVCGISINMLSANAHLLSDLLRSTTTLVEGLVIEFADVNSTLADGWSALIICILIILGGVGSIYFWAREVWQEWKLHRQSDTSFHELDTEQHNALHKAGSMSSNGSEDVRNSADADA